MIKFLITAAFVLVFVFILFLLLSLMAWIGGIVLRSLVKSPACGEGLGWSLSVIQFPFDFIDGILSASVVPLCVPFFFAF